MHSLLLRRLARAAGVAALGGLLLVPAGIEDSESTGVPVTGSYYGRPTPPATGSGMRVFLDENGRPTTPPATAAKVGVLRSTTTRQALAPTSEPARGTDAPGGGKILRLDDRFTTYSVARLGADGTLSVTCEGLRATRSGHVRAESSP